MKTVCKTNECVGCMACVASCAKDAIELQDDMVSLNAVIDPEKCVNCGLCSRICQVNNPLKTTAPILWREGWAKNDDLRIDSTSGGLATAIMIAFVNNGGVVCSCSFRDGEFVYQLATSKEQIKCFTGSKYVKSNPKEAYSLVKNSLMNGERVLFVGLPCHVAGIRNTINSKLQEKLYIVDIICHGTPSYSLFKKYLSDKEIQIADLKDIRFRYKKGDSTSSDYQALAESGILDSYTYSFLRQVNLTENCYSCKYAKTERVSDLSLGDSWGSEEINEAKKGISLILCQSEKGMELLQQAEVNLKDVNIENAVNHNSQLQHPARCPESRKLFFEEIKQGKNYDKAIARCYPRIFLKQRIKGLLIKTKILNGEEQQYRIRYIK